MTYLQSTDVFFGELVVDVSQNQRRLSDSTFAQQHDLEIQRLTTPIRRT